MEEGDETPKGNKEIGQIETRTEKSIEDKNENNEKCQSGKGASPKSNKSQNEQIETEKEEKKEQNENSSIFHFPKVILGYYDF